MATDYRQPPVRLQSVRLPSVRNLADPPKAPHSADAFERAACKALGLPYHKDVESRHGERVYHRLGTYRIADSEPAIGAVVSEFGRQGLTEKPFYTYREYLHAVGRVEPLRSARRQFRITEMDERFLHLYSIERATPDTSGYLWYLLLVVPVRDRPG